MNNNKIEYQKVLEDMSGQIAHLVESFIELGVLVHDYQATDTSSQSLSIRLNQTIEQLQALNSMNKQQLDKLPIPKDVLEYIEDGRNPNVYTREFVESTRKTNQLLRGKMNNFRQLELVLGNKLAEEFPELKENIEDIQKRTE